MVFGKDGLNDDQFFQKLVLKNSSLSMVKMALDEGELRRAKVELASHMRVRENPRFFFNPRKKENTLLDLEKYFQQSTRQTVKLAEEIVNHKFDIFGREISFNGEINWHASLDGDKEWPLSFSSNIDYFSTIRLGDIKFAWELNRTQHFVTLGKAYWLTEDERFLTEFQDQLLDWIKKNPYKRGINWMAGIETAIRLISWIWAYIFFSDTKLLNEHFVFEFLRSIYLQTKFIEQHLSDKWQLNNNHLIAEAVGLIYVGIIFPEFAEAQRWKELGIKILEKELKTQILSDGVIWEQSTGYHRFVADLCLHTVILAEKNDVPVPRIILLKLEQMIEFLNQIVMSDGLIPIVGDGDEARVVKLDETAYNDVRSTITVGSILFGKDWLCTKSEEAYWLLGKKALTEESKYMLTGYKVFRDSGYIVMQDKDKYLLFVVGPKDSRYLQIAGHNHLDMLSFILNVYGTSFLVDPGTYTYFGDFEWRKYFKGIKAHNTVVIDDSDPVDIEEFFDLSHVPSARICKCATDDNIDWISAKYNGYLSVNHFRTIFFFNREYWVIIDLLEGSGDHTYDLYFHFNYGLEVTFDKSDYNAVAKSPRGNLRIIPLITSGLKGEIIEGKVSPRYGTIVKGSVLRYRRMGTPPQIFITLFYPFKNDGVQEELAIENARTHASAMGVAFLSASGYYEVAKRNL